MRVTLNAVSILAFGVIALVGLIVLAGTGHLDDATRGILQAVTFGSLAGAAGVATPPPAVSHVVTAAAPVDEPTAGLAAVAE